MIGGWRRTSIRRYPRVLPTPPIPSDFASAAISWRRPSPVNPVSALRGLKPDYTECATFGRPTNAGWRQSGRADLAVALDAIGTIASGFDIFPGALNRVASRQRQ